MANFDRQYRLAAGKAGGVGFEVGKTSGSQPMSLHINFSIEKTDLESQNTGKLSIWNLSSEHKAALNEKDCLLTLKAGYGTIMPIIFSGIVTYATTVLDNADRRTDVELVDNRVEIRDTFVSLSYKGKTNAKKLIQDVAGKMGVTVVFSYNAKFANYSNGFSFVGAAKDALSKICKSSKLSWSIQNGVLHVKNPNDVLSKEVYVLNTDSGLIGMPAEVTIDSDSGAKQKGWDVEFLLNGAINIDDYVKLESKEATGYFRVYSLQHEGDNYSGEWKSKARLLEVS